MTRLDREARVTIKTLAARGASNAAVARLLGVSEGAVRYHLARLAAGAVDGRGTKPFKATSFAAAIEQWREVQEDGAINLAALHEWLVAEHGYDGSLRSVQRFWAKRYPVPTIRARRRVETPPGAQAQADWAHFPHVIVGGEAKSLVAFKMVLSHSRKDAIVWSDSKDTLAWLRCHTQAFRRLGRHQHKLSPLRDDAALPCCRLSAAPAAMQRKDRAASPRPALRHRPAALPLVRSRGPAALDRCAADGPSGQADLPGHRPD